MRHIYISPHFDDAVLSCGGLIWEQTQKGIPVEIWTICAGDAPPGQLSALAQACHSQWGINSALEVVSARRIENEKATALVGADTVNFSIPDCIYRRSPAGELLYPAEVFVSIDPIEKKLGAEISAALTSELLPGDVVCCPLTIGGHLDHVLARHASERLGCTLWYYADIPYLFNHPELLSPATDGLQDTLYPVSKTGLKVWQKGIASYATQIAMLFETKEKMLEAIRSYWESQGGIRLWCRDQDR
jgi:LmbE family N-acetylglucosaminyl deacetylase